MTSISFFKKIKGFTLLELVVALAIFAVLSLTAWQVFNGIMKTRDRATIQANQLMQIQHTYMQLQGDLIAIVPRNERRATGDPESALNITATAMALSRATMLDPILSEHFASNQLSINNTITNTTINKLEMVHVIQRVHYDVVGDKLIRSVSEKTDLTGILKPTSQMLLKGVTAFKVSALNPAASDFWPNASTTLTAASLSQLPLGVQVELTVGGIPITWQFALAGSM